MFETVVPEVVVRRSRRVFYETLPISLLVHAAAIGGILTQSVWTVAFPVHSPRMMLAYSLTKLPDPPPPPPPPPAARPAAKVVQTPTLPKPAPPPPPTQIVAPTVIPDLIPQVTEPPPPPPPVEAAPAIVEQAPHAVAGGDPKGDALGELGGKKYGTVGGINFGDDGRVHIDRHEKLPLKVVEQPLPAYPEWAYKDHLDDRCVVRYTIGTNGRVIDAAIIEHAKNEKFEPPLLDVIKKWRFRPMMVNGKPVEVVHELEMFYQYNQR